MHKATENYWKRFNTLPANIQNIARKKFYLLNKNPHHPSLHFKKIGKFWSIRISLDYRALCYKDQEDFIWVWIGTHEDYNKMLRK